MILDGDTVVLRSNRAGDERIAMALAGDLAAFLFELVATGVNGSALPIKLGGQPVVCGNEFFTGFWVIGDKFFRRFRQFATLIDDRF